MQIVLERTARRLTNQSMLNPIDARAEDRIVPLRVRHNSELKTQTVAGIATAILLIKVLPPPRPRTQTTMQSCASAATLRSGGPILPIGMKAKGACRESTTSNRHQYPITRAETVGGVLSVLRSLCPTPSGTTPCHTNRHRAISSWRDKATIMGVGAPRAFSVRVRYHCVKALSFWYVRNRHTNWIMPRQNRPLSERANTFSGRHTGLWPVGRACFATAPPACRPEAVAAGLKGNDNAFDPTSYLLCFLPPSMKQLQ